MKKMIVILCLVFLMGCQDIEPKENQSEIIKNVAVTQIQTKEHQSMGFYTGHVKTGTITQLSFEVSGKIKKILVNEGDFLSVGDVLSEIDTEAFTFALNAAEAEYNASKSQYSKALEAKEYALNTLTQTQQLVLENIASQYDLDQAALNVRITENDVSGAREMRNQAEINVKAKQYQIDKSQMIASKEGIVLSILSEEGELVGAGYPVIILRDLKNVVSFGVSIDNYTYLEIDQIITMYNDDTTFKGRIQNISELPDNITQTYEVEIAIEKELNIGNIINIEIPLDKIYGSKIPLGAIRSDGEDYVYIVEENRAKRCNIEVVEILNQEVVVMGLPEDASLIVEGFMNIVSGDAVKVVE